MSNSPIQVVLNSDNFIEARDRAGGGVSKEFYEDDAAGFTAHKASVKKNLLDLGEKIATNEFADMGYAKLVLKRSAWAKSHRPTHALFRKDITPIVGAGDIGELFLEVTRDSLSHVARKIDEAEDTLAYRDINGKVVANPSRNRSELGAIEKIEEYTAIDKRSFSVEQGFRWLSDGRTGGNYMIELFEVPPPRAEWDLLPPQKLKLFRSFIDGLNTVGQGLVAQRITDTVGSYPMMGLRLDKSADAPELQFLPASTRKRDHDKATLAPFDDRIERHKQLITFLDKHPLVKKIHLPPIIKRSQTQTAARPTTVTIPAPVQGKAYPRIAVVDGGIGDVLKPWIIDRWQYLSPNHRSEDHGTFIAGLAVVGGQLNGLEVCAETDGCQLVDIDILPDEQERFAQYFNSPMEFIDELEVAVQTLKARCGVRIFNFSINVEQAVESDSYHPFARRLDHIAHDNDVIFVISAGNTAPNDMRAEWSENPTNALASLALARNDGIRVPAESIRNVSVASVNPPNMSNALAYAPAAYSCRGPGMRIGLKPELAHVGGAGNKCPQRGYGLYSISPGGGVVDGCGTSYATPLVAKMLASLDQAIEGDVSRETLMALASHHATMPEILVHNELKEVVPHLVGFGVPSSAGSILEGNENQITLVFANRLKKGKLMRFNFSWPRSLVKDGKCLGSAKLTLVSTPPLDYKYGAEFVRVNINAQLMQEQEGGNYKGMLKSVLSLPSGGHDEAELIAHSLKWSPTKVLEKTFKRGVGKSTNWRLEVDYLLRDGEEMPDNGVPFTVLLTISDDKQEAPVFNDARQMLLSSAVQITDIQTAARVLARI